MPSFTNKLAVKDTIALKAGMWCKESIFLKYESDSPSIKDLIRVLSLQVIIWLKAKSTINNLMPFIEAKLSNLTILDNTDFNDSKLLSNVLKDKKKSSILELIKNI